MRYFAIFAVIVLLATGCNDNSSTDTESTYSPSSYSQDSAYDDGYSWAEDNDTDNFGDCQSEFGTSEEEDGCNDYVKENHTGSYSFNGYGCTEDCSGHEAGYSWAEDNGIEDESDCDGNSNSFNEGCISYVEENY